MMLFQERLTLSAEDDQELLKASSVDITALNTADEGVGENTEVGNLLVRTDDLTLVSPATLGGGCG
jgi:hypothetical protein